MKKILITTIVTICAILGMKKVEANAYSIEVRGYRNGAYYREKVEWDKELIYNRTTVTESVSSGFGAYIQELSPGSYNGLGNYVLVSAEPMTVRYTYMRDDGTIVQQININQNSTYTKDGRYVYKRASFVIPNNEDKFLEMIASIGETEIPIVYDTKPYKSDELDLTPFEYMGTEANDRTAIISSRWTIKYPFSQYKYKGVYELYLKNTVYNINTGMLPVEETVRTWRARTDYPNGKDIDVSITVNFPSISKAKNIIREKGKTYWENLKADEILGYLGEGYYDKLLRHKTSRTYMETITDSNHGNYVAGIWLDIALDEETIKSLWSDDSWGDIEEWEYQVYSAMCYISKAKSGTSEATWNRDTSKTMIDLIEEQGYPMPEGPLIENIEGEDSPAIYVNPAQIVDSYDIDIIATDDIKSFITGAWSTLPAEVKLVLIFGVGLGALGVLIKLILQL